jgi:hypothetical protein
MLSSVISVALRHESAMTGQELLNDEQHDLSGIASQVGNDAESCAKKRQSMMPQMRQVWSHAAF